MSPSNDSPARPLRSEHADTFNHDEDAAEYDQDVRNEADPIRTAYEQVLDWVRDQAAVLPTDEVLELGSGTGNLTRRLPDCQRIVAVDISTEMTHIAQEKLGSRPEVTWRQADVLEALGTPSTGSVGQPAELYDVIVSTYTLHHLTEPEKEMFWKLAKDRCRSGARIVVGDLAFESDDERASIHDSLADRGHDEAAEAVREEFFWNLENTARTAADLGLDLRLQRFSELSWGLCARLP